MATGQGRSLLEGLQGSGIAESVSANPGTLGSEDAWRLERCRLLAALSHPRTLGPSNPFSPYWQGWARISPRDHFSTK